LHIASIEEKPKLFGFSGIAQQISASHPQIRLAAA